ncbi:MAG: outer membrane lipoprotein carrier protein LolA [Bacteroidota bacterium]
MRRLFLIIFGISMASGMMAQDLFSQAKEQAFNEQSDPDAVAIMDDVEAKYDAFSTIEVGFKLEMVEGDNSESQEGRVFIKDDQYKLEMKEQDIICNGNTIWFHLKNQNEVQINNPDPEGGDLSPASMIKLYEQDMLYALIGEVKEDEKQVYHIEFKPKDRDSDFFKYRASIDKNTKELTKVIAFGKDATRYIVSFKETISNNALTDNFFTFDPSQFKDIHIEDLRIE